MNHFSSPQLFLSAKAKQLGIALIQELYIQRSTPLAFYLNVNPSYDGHEAVLFWTENYLEQHQEASLAELRQHFFNLVPQC